MQVILIDLIMCLHLWHQIFIYMKKNMGTADRIIRVIIAAIMGVLYFNGTVTGTLGIVLLILSIIFVLTSLVSFCPLYKPFGINTCSVKK
jgi:hypothetical protein